jgi:hypothetical protein
MRTGKYRLLACCAIAALSLAALAGCDQNGDEDIIGTWTGSVQVDADTTRDVVMTFESSGAYFCNLFESGYAGIEDNICADSSDGSYTFSSGSLVLVEEDVYTGIAWESWTDAPVTVTYPASIDGDILTIDVGDMGNATIGQTWTLTRQ